MVQRHLSIPHKFICFTDDPTNLNSNIDVRSLPNNKKFSGWWWKPYLFNVTHYNAEDINLFFDLDMVIVSNIDKLVNYMPDKFIGLRDVGRVFGRGIDKLGSAVLKWPASKYDEVWTNIEKDPGLVTKFQGDQDYIWHTHKQHITFFPDPWIRSYKWEVRNRSELVRLKSGWNFNSIRIPELDPQTSVLAFHGTPNPHEVKDPIIVDNWQ